MRLVCEQRARRVRNDLQLYNIQRLDAEEENPLLLASAYLCCRGLWRSLAGQHWCGMTKPIFIDGRVLSCGKATARLYESAGLLVFAEYTRSLRITGREFGLGVSKLMYSSSLRKSGVSL